MTFLKLDISFIKYITCKINNYKISTHQIELILSNDDSSNEIICNTIKYLTNTQCEWNVDYFKIIRVVDNNIHSDYKYKIKDIFYNK